MVALRLQDSGLGPDRNYQRQGWRAVVQAEGSFGTLRGQEPTRKGEAGIPQGELQGTPWKATSAFGQEDGANINLYA